MRHRQFCQRKLFVSSLSRALCKGFWISNIGCFQSLLPDLPCICPFRVRFHYGHPDVFDRLFHLARGGVSKASKTINLSEDIFAGMLMLLVLYLSLFPDFFFLSFLSLLFIWPGLLGVNDCL